MRRKALGALAAVAATLVAPSAAAAITYAPPDQPSPPLSVPQAELAAALSCSDGVAGATRAPVLLVPGTAENQNDEFSWTWEPALDALGVPWCAVQLPHDATGDIQTSAEYVVNAIRAMHAQAGRRIAIIGHSQGGMLPRWVLRFWPDTRPMVDDLIGLAPSNHGTESSVPFCASPCPASFRQQTAGSEFIKALNSFQETFPGIAYTVVYTHTDEVVTPNADDNGSSPVHGGGGTISNVPIQQVCPADSNEHLALGTYDPVAYALAVDALDNPGPADPARISSAVCSQPYMPGVNPATFASDEGMLVTSIGNAIASAEQVSVEPPLRCYVTASCDQASANVCQKHKRKKHRKGHHRAAESKKHKKKHRSCKKHKKHKKHHGRARTR
jgi:triacylglycerol esterase/lipase EstA (alpha/beta hydrolase family)